MVIQSPLTHPVPACHVRKERARKARLQKFVVARDILRERQGLWQFVRPTHATFSSDKLGPYPRNCRSMSLFGSKATQERM